MKLDHAKNVEAIEMMADMLGPLSRICSNPETTKARKNVKTKLEFVQILLKNNAEDIIELLAIADGKDPETYECTALGALQGLMQLLAREEMMQLFGLQSQKKDETHSGSAAENATQ